MNKVNKVNNQKYLDIEIQIQKASFKSLRTSEQGEQSEQTKIPRHINSDSESFIQILQNK